MDDDDSDPLPDVLLNAVSMNSNGFILYPADGSNVWVAEIDGPGKWGLVKCSTLKKVSVKIGSTVFEITDGEVSAADGKGAELVMSGGKFQLKNGAMDFLTVQKNFVTYMLRLTLNTPTGPTTGLMPTSAVDFNQALIDINLLFS